jgi:hypothetical protein
MGNFLFSDFMHLFLLEKCLKKDEFSTLFYQNFMFVDLCFLKYAEFNYFFRKFN